ncbi:thioredoxin family protein [Shewanella sp. Isolate11]|uniref:thioredoxin family protein n=1 Tax=Shewanella sp. Isolate11 TaxID=2908530 RepID=UPI001EFCD5E9|nr:thioredoxin family protein [Shewanella sp. Isolate11]MCG9697672.1 thioredoxin family protein [Shewanella sp. Isolate11]
MKQFKVLGSGCAKCENTAKLIEKLALEHGVDITVEKVMDLETFMDYGVMSTPAVVLNEALVHSGGIPPTDKVLTWLGA